MASRYELRLKARLGTTADIAARRGVDLRVAAFLARKGSFDEAERIISEVRSEFSKADNAEVLSRANFAEGIIRYFKSGPASSIDKLSRSVALSSGLRQFDEFPALPLAWLAACHRQRADWVAMLDALKRSIASLTPDGVEANCRVCIIIADILNEIRDYRSSAIWYGRARRYASEIGDDTAITAMLYNRVALKLFNSRLNKLLDLPIDVEGCAVAIEAFSAQNYADFTAENSMRWVFDILQGQLSLLQGDYKASYVALSGAALDQQLEGWPGVRCLRSADMVLARSLSRTDYDSQVEAAVSDVLSASIDDLPFGDRVLIFDSCFEALRSIGSETAESVRAARDEFLAEYKAEIASEREALADLENWIVGQGASTLLGSEKIFSD